MKRQKKIILPDGSKGYQEIDLCKKLNFEFLRYTNLTHSTGKHDLPELVCNTEILPDYIALSSYPAQFHRTRLTAVGFWEYDEKFDGFDGLFNAIYYNRKELLQYYRERFAGVNFFFTPDYSQFGEVSDIEENYRLLKARIVGIWLTMEIGAVVIPFITVATIKRASFALDGLENCSVVAFSTKGYVENPVERNIIKELVRLTVDKLNLKSIVVYDVCSSNDAVEEIFAYAIKCGIKVVVPQNALKERNVALKEGRHAKQ